MCTYMYIYVYVYHVIYYTILYHRVTQLFHSTGYNILQHPKCRWESYLRNLPGKCYFCWGEVKDTSLASQISSTYK